MRTFNLVAAAALASAASLAGHAGRTLVRIPDFQVKRHVQGRRLTRMLAANGSIAGRNRWTGQPHEHRRAIARRLRQAERRAGVPSG